MPRILLTHIPDMLANYYGPRALAALRAHGEVKIHESGTAMDTAALIAAARGCAIVVTDRQTAVPAEFFAQAPDTAAVLRVAVDIRNIDVDAASKAGILVTRATPGFIASVAEQTIGFIIDCARNIGQYSTAYRQGEIPKAYPGLQLKGATLGIIGYGDIAQYLAPIGVALGMQVLINDPFKTISGGNPKQAELPELLRASDFVVCLVVANEKTENLMNAAVFAQMKRSAYFINMSRGNLVDEAALAAALDAKTIAGAAMDVGRAPDQMPTPSLAKRSDVIATPHSAGLTPQAIEHQAFDTVRQVGDLVAGRIPPEAVNAQAANRLERLLKP